MAGFEGMILTKQGIDLQLKIHSGESSLELTRIALGDGELQKGFNIEDLTALIHETVSLKIEDLKKVSNQYVTVQTSFNNFNLERGMYVREIGLFAKESGGEEILYAVSNAGDKADYLPATGTDVVEEIIAVNINVGNADSLHVTIDASLQYLSKKEWNEYLEKQRILVEENSKAHEGLQEQITVLSGPYVIPEGTDLPVSKRKKGKMYFKVTSRQSGGGVNESIKVSPTMGLKIQSGG